MLDQLRSAVTIAQAIQADVDRIIAEPQPKPARRRPYRTYTFMRSGDMGTRLIVGVPFQRDQTTYLSARQYDRFVRLANSGKYFIEIMDSDFGVAWMMRRQIA